MKSDIFNFFYLIRERKIFMNNIEAIRQQNIFKVQPVKWNEPNKYEQGSSAVNFAQKTGIYSPQHPNMQSPTCANKLDLLA